MRLGDSVVTYQLYTEGATAAVMGTVGSHSISVRTNATERMRVDAGGNVNVGYGATSPTATTATSNFTVAGQVGINTNAPRGKLDVTTTAGYGNNDAIVFGTGTFTYPTAQYGGQGAIVSKGTTSDARLMVQDGNGRINNYWNAYTDTGGYKYIVSGEPASRDVMTVNGLAGAEFGWYSAPSGTAGTALTWTQIARMVGGTSGFTWFSPRGTSSDFYIDVAGNVSMGGNLSITNNVSMSSNLTVSGTATVANVITTSGVFWANGSAYSSGSIVYTASATAPVAPKNGDQWYKTTTNVLYEYITDGTSSFWLDIQSPVVTGNNVVSTTTTDSLSPFLLMGA